jgi:hypothetical protein
MFETILGRISLLLPLLHPLLLPLLHALTDPACCCCCCCIHSGLDMFVRLMRDCWSQQAADRPCFEVIARRLKAMQRWRKLKVRHAAV